MRAVFFLNSVVKHIIEANTHRNTNKKWQQTRKNRFENVEKWHLASKNDFWLQFFSAFLVCIYPIAAS